MTTKTSPGAAAAKLEPTHAGAAKRRQLAERVGSRTAAAELEAADRVGSVGWARV